jgi:DNA-binding XRE family transcriptional regulator
MKTITPQQAIERLIERDWMPTQIAVEIGVNKSTISRIQCGKVQPTFKVGQALTNLVSSRRKGPKR